MGIECLFGGYCFEDLFLLLTSFSEHFEFKMLSMIRPTPSLRRALSRSSTPLARCYHENILDHYENPRNVGSLDKKSKNVGTGLVGAPACGDVMKLQFEVDEEGTITDAKFKTFGCGSAIASSSV